MAPTAADGSLRCRGVGAGGGSRDQCPHALVAVRDRARLPLHGVGHASQGRAAMSATSGRGPVTGPRKSLWQRIKDVARGGVDAGSLERLETLLIESDFGVRVSARLVADMERLARRGDIKTRDDFEGALRDAVAHALTSGNSDPSLRHADAGPTVILVLGVNGAGKTTFIGKLATRLKGEGKRVLVAAGDTDRKSV